MIKYIALLLLVVSFADPAEAAGDGTPLNRIKWPFEGATGTVDRQAAQRGFQVYKEVCASCHSLKRIAYRNLQDIGFSEQEVKALAAEAVMMDGPNDDGDMFERVGRPSDLIPPPFANDNAARAANGGAYPPDLSLMVKARPDGANYLYSLLTGYRDAPDDMKMGEGMNYNLYFPGKQIAMPAPLSDDMVSYQDNTPATVDQMAKDLTIFLQWTAEPEMEIRKKMGIKVIVYLLIFTVLFYFAKKRIWHRLYTK